MTITPQEDQISGIYVNLMAEIRDRLRSLDRSRRPEFSNPMFGEEYLAAEYGMLQLRMVCELIALACVVAHGDLPVTRSGKFKNEYSADVILKKLETFHADFFPKPIRSVPARSGVPDLQESVDGLNKDEMVKLYRYCLDRLHRDRVKNILSGKRRLYDYKYLDESITKLLWLLNEHIIVLSREDGRRAWVQMDAGNGQVRWNWLILQGPDAPGNAPRAR